MSSEKGKKLSQGAKDKVSKDVTFKEDKLESERALDFSNNGYGLPPLKNPNAWPKWLDMLKKTLMNESQTTHLALYIYCKKQALIKNNQQ